MIILIMIFIFSSIFLSIFLFHLIVYGRNATENKLYEIFKSVNTSLKEFIIIIKIMPIIAIFIIMCISFILYAIGLISKLFHFFNHKQWANDICSSYRGIKIAEDIICRHIAEDKYYIGVVYNWFIYSDNVLLILFFVIVLCSIILYVPIFILNYSDSKWISSGGMSIIVRETIARTFYIAPFWLAFLYLPAPFNILAPCLLILKQKLPSSTDLYELQVLSKQALITLSRLGTDEDRERFDRIKKAFIIEDTALDDADVDAGMPKFLMDTIFSTLEGISIAAMIVWFLLV